MSRYLNEFFKYCKNKNYLRDLKCLYYKVIISKVIEKKLN